MNFRTLSLIDKLGLQVGSEVQKHRQFMIMQVEKFDSKDRYYRRWFPLSYQGLATIEQVREELEEEDSELRFKKTILLTGNENMVRRIRSKFGFCVEAEERKRL